MTRTDAPDSPSYPTAADDAFDLADIECSEIAPTLAKHLRTFEAGALVRVRTGRRSAMEGLRSWCRLTGNVLEREEGMGDALDFYIRRKSSPQP